MTLLLLGLAAPAEAQRVDRSAGSGRGASRVQYTEDGFVYTVAAGDTLSEVAERLEVPLDRLLAENPGVRADRIRIGQRLHVRSGLRRVEHVVQPGETLSALATRYEVRVRDLLAWNRRLSRNRVRTGRRLVVFTRLPASRSSSIGSPDRGRLEHASRLRPGLGYAIRDPERSYATDETIRSVRVAFARLNRADRAAPRVQIHDLSLRSGGPMRGHRSHESGRDVDIAYFQRRCPDRECAFRRIGPEHLDVERQWALFRPWLESGEVEAIFMDHALQRALYTYARSQGESVRTLDRWFQYPRAVDDRYGVIRHHPNHADHFHVRFVCHETDTECR